MDTIPCYLCKTETADPQGFCSEACYAEYRNECDRERCPECGETAYPCDCDGEAVYDPRYDEPVDIDSDVGYDPYAGGPEPYEYGDEMPW